MAANGTGQVKSPLERQTDRLRYALAVVGNKALTYARELGFEDWDACEKALRSEAVAQAIDGQKRAVPLAAPAEAPAADATPAAPDRPRPVIQKAARALIAEQGVDEDLLFAFLGNRGTGQFGNVTVADVQRYLGDEDA